jgi:kanamycin kinase/aminoglycoside 3'-phosphotransferase-2
MQNRPSDQEMPRSLTQLFSVYRWTQIFEGWSESKVFRLESSNDDALYLKTGPRSPLRPVWEEKRRLEWLYGKLPVPALLLFAEDEGIEYLLMTEIPGKRASDYRDQADLPQIIRQLAAGLRMVHNLEIVECPFDATLGRTIEWARQRIELGLVDENDFDERYLGRKAENLFDEVKERSPTEEDLVFTHGDFCLPNIILKDEMVRGFIDVGRAGIADRWQDIALVTRSIRFNYGTEWVNHFFSAYGIEPDYSKLEFYTLLDEFF